MASSGVRLAFPAQFEVALSELVTVVIPAYNARSTIDETLRSVRAQSWTNLDIIVVDDGSRDDTGDIARCHAALDSRIRVHRQENAGVAIARNTGARLARSDLLSFVDSDDLWTPDKTERQLAALRAGGSSTGLVYSWYSVIDGDSRITAEWPGPTHQGDVLGALFRENFIGNGSSVLVRRAAFEAAGGFEPALHWAGAQGCEDILFYCRVAEHFDFAVAPGYLIGYRELANNMSSNLPRMLRSWLLVVDEMRARHPDKLDALSAGLDHFARWLVRKAILTDQPNQLPKLVLRSASRSPKLALDLLRREIPRTWSDHRRDAKRAKAATAAPCRRFVIGDPG